MGSGIEQLMMVGTVLAIQDRPPNIFLEEPENFLHPGSQRYLAEQLLDRAKQSFITSHSTVFVDTTRSTIFRVHRAGYWTEVDPAKDAVA
jgi:predicted ATP-dependent endonuclease of OLD family